MRKTVSGCSDEWDYIWITLPIFLKNVYQEENKTLDISKYSNGDINKGKLRDSRYPDEETSA